MNERQFRILIGLLRSLTRALIWNIRNNYDDKAADAVWEDYLDWNVDWQEYINQP